MSGPTLRGVPLTGAELDEWNARQAAGVDARREVRGRLFKEQARTLIEALPAFGGRTGNDYRDRAANLQARVTELQDIVLFGGTFTAEEQAEYDAIKATFAAIKTIRLAENTASSALASAGADEHLTISEREAEIDAVLDVEARLA